MKNSIRDRRKILSWLAGGLSVVMFWKYFKTEEKTEKPVRMLTEDGQLVEVDPKFLKSTGQRLQSKEIQTWVKRKK